MPQIKVSDVWCLRFVCFLCVAIWLHLQWDESIMNFGLLCVSFFVSLFFPPYLPLPVCVCMHLYVPCHVCGGQRTTFQWLFLHFLHVGSEEWTPVLRYPYLLICLFHWPFEIFFILSLISFMNMYHHIIANFLISSEHDKKPIWLSWRNCFIP